MARFALICLLSSLIATPAVAADNATPEITIIATGAPVIFGAKPISIKSTNGPFDAKWANARATPLKEKTVEWAKAFSSKPLEERVRTINEYVNRQIRYRTDKGDEWKDAATTIKDGIGDCEDYALLKLALLEAAGVNPNDMFLTIARHIKMNADHAMLMVRVGNKLMVLDNNTLAIVDGTAPGDFMPVLTYSANGKWAHTDVPGHVIDRTHAYNGKVALSLAVAK